MPQEAGELPPPLDAGKTSASPTSPGKPLVEDKPQSPPETGELANLLESLRPEVKAREKGTRQLISDTQGKEAAREIFQQAKDIVDQRRGPPITAFARPRKYKEATPAKRVRHYRAEKKREKLDEEVRRRWEPFNEDDFPVSGGVEEEAIQGALTDQMISALYRLPDEYRQVLIARYSFGLTQEQAAHELGMTRAQLIRRERQAIDFLRGMLC